GGQHQAVGVEDVLGPAGVLPPAFDEDGRHGATRVYQALDGVGDLVLALGAGFEPPDGFVDRRVEDVDAGDRQVAGWYLGLLDKFGHAAALDDRHAQGARVGHRHQRQHRVDTLFRLEGRGEVVDAAFEEVVGQVHDERVVTQERLRHLDGVRQSPRRVLHDVLEGDALDVGQCLADGDLGGDADHHADVIDAGRAQVVDRVM